MGVLPLVTFKTINSTTLVDELMNFNINELQLPVKSLTGLTRHQLNTSSSLVASLEVEKGFEAR